MDNKNIQNAENKLELLNNDDDARAYAEYVADAERNEISALAHAKAETQIQIIKKMLLENMEIELISKVTSVSIDEILKIKNSL